MVLVQWVAVAGALLVAGAAWFQARRVARQLDDLAAKHWELKYQYSELRTRLDAASGPGSSAPAAAPAVTTAAVIPIASLKR
jgi:hypothetical protein